ncbi:MAG: tetratricopeptide repeat protein [Myxococcota bacterium]
MAKETRKLRRAQEQKDPAKERDLLKRPAVAKPIEVGDPLGPQQFRGLLLRLGLPLLAIWLVCGFLVSMVYSEVWKGVLIAIPALLTLAAVGLVIWVLRQAKKARGVASILKGVETQEDRKAAIDKLEANFKKSDPAALFARAQLELQEDPKKALATLEQIDLNKVMAPVADEARSQRAMIHLMQGEVSQARQLVDNIDLSRHQDPRSRAMMASVCAEAWARSGNAKKAVETLGLFDAEDAAFEQLRPQLYRASAFACAQTGDAKGMRRALKKLAAQDVRLLGGFMVKRTHPLLQKEAKKLIEQSGLPRRMMVQRG